MGADWRITNESSLVRPGAVKECSPVLSFTRDQLNPFKILLSTLNSSCSQNCTNANLHFILYKD